MATSYESFREEIEEKGYRFTAILIKLSNAVLVFFYEGGDMKLGTLAVALPFGDGPCVSSILLGERNMVITKILAERFASAFKGITLVSTFLVEIGGSEVSSTLLKLTKKLLDKVGLQ